KPYFVIGLHPEQQATHDVGSWYRFLTDRSAASDLFHPAVDEIVADHNLPVWVTREYSHAIPGRWTPDEIASGLNKVYRFILREDGEIPPSLIEAVRLLPFVRFAHTGHVIGSALPSLQFGSFSSGRSWRAADNIGLDDARSYTRGDPSVRVAVLDTGVWLE